MRYALLSDIHANRPALEAVLSAARGRYETLICLGDVVGYGAHPNECCELLRENGAICVLGNHDAAVLGLEIYDEWNEIAVSSLDWTRRQLSRENGRFLESSGPARLIERAGELSFWITHGNLEEPFYNEYVFSIGPAFDELERLGDTGAPISFYGHTHQAMRFQTPAPFHFRNDIAHTRTPHGDQTRLSPETLSLVNVGSVGQPRDGNPQARFALFDAQSAILEIVAVDYNIQAAQTAISDAGLDQRLAKRLAEGQ